MDSNNVKNLTEKIGNEIKNKLKEKYQQEFEIKALGKRFGTAENNTVTAYCYPKENEELLFEIVMDIKGKIKEDTYNIRKICYFIEKEIQKGFEEKNINSYCSSYMVGDVKEIENKKIEQVLEEGKISFRTNIIINENIQNECILEVYKKIQEKYNNINIISNIYITTDNEAYSTCKRQMVSVPYVLRNMFKKYPIDRQIRIQIKEGKIDI